MGAFNLDGTTTLVALGPAGRRTSTLTGAAFDVRDYIGTGAIVQQASAAVAGTAPTLNGKIQDSADGSTGWADVAGAVFAEVTDAAANEKIGIAFNAVKRYLRYVGTIAGTDTPTFDFACALIGRKQIV